MSHTRFALTGIIGNIVKISTAGALILICAAAFFAQKYKGAPVKKDRLVKALRSKQLKTGDIVSIIRSNGVDFALTPEIRKILIEAGARPEVIEAADKNLRLPSDADNFAIGDGRTSADYEDLIEQALFVFKDKNNPAAAVQFLETAVKIKPDASAAFQMLGFVQLYGLKNSEDAAKYMRESIKRGGSAVFRVFHDDGDDFEKRCTGSLYVSPENIRYESDDNVHTFETSIRSVSDVKLDRENSKIWKNYPFLKIFLKIGESKSRFRFAPLEKNQTEAQIAAQMILEAKIN